MWHLNEYHGRIACKNSDHLSIHGGAASIPTEAFILKGKLPLSLIPVHVYTALLRASARVYVFACVRKLEHSQYWKRY